jgi:hypothetical protein
MSTDATRCSVTKTGESYNIDLSVLTYIYKTGCGKTFKDDKLYHSKSLRVCPFCGKIIEGSDWVVPNIKPKKP